MTKKIIKEDKSIIMEQKIEEKIIAQKPNVEKKAENLSISVLNEKIELLKNEVIENKLYLELCFISLLILIFGYFKSDIGQESIRSGSVLGKIIIAITIGLYLGIVFFFYSIIRFNHKNKELIKEKIDSILQK